MMGVCLAILLSVLPMLTQQKAEAAEYRFNMSYIYFGNFTNYTKLVDSTQNSLGEVSPNYFGLDKNGDLALTASVSMDFINDMHERDVSVVPYLTNDWSRAVGKAALNNRDNLARDMADAVVLYELDGVNIDIENVTSSEREAYVEFARLLKELLPDGKTVAVSVAANPWGLDTGWQGSYDYAGLSEFCDYLMVMTYDEHYYGGPAGPISSYDYIDKSLKYAVSVVPKEKIVLGLPFYGRIWSADGGHPNGYGVSNTMIAQLINDYGGAVTIDPVSRSTRAVITIGESEIKPVVGGQALAAGTYTIWYEGESSVKSKLELVNKYDIKGTGSWSLGQESDNTWNYYKLWLNDCTFNDIETSWAKDYILDAYLKSWITGYSADNFSPDEPLTRAQAAVILVRRLGLSPQLDPACRFDDCVGYWAQAYLETARKYHIIQGIGDNMFNPDRPITREEIAVMVNNVLKYQNTFGDGLFSDVTRTSNPWSFDAIEALSANGIITGFQDGSYQPGNTLSRAEMAVIAAMMPSIDSSSLIVMPTTSPTSSYYLY